MILKQRPHAYELSQGFAQSSNIASEGFSPGAKDEWWTPDIDRKTLKALMKRQDAKLLINYGLWLVLLAGSGIAAFFAWGSLWAVPAFLVYGTIYSSCNARSHDLGHGATFKTGWLNDAFLHLTLFMTLKEPVDWRWRHTRHHTDTIHVGRDPEIFVTRPADLLRVFADFFFLMQIYGEVRVPLLRSFGIVSGDARYYVPENEWPRIIRSSRLMIGSIVAVIAWCVAAGSLLPLMFLWGPRIYGNWLDYLGTLTQHTGLAEDAHDHRLNTRTFLLDPVRQFLYANLNYHIEHHIYPMVPYYDLPKLHELMKPDLPYTYRGILDVMREVIPALFRQAREPGYFVRREFAGA